MSVNRLEPAQIGLSEIAHHQLERMVKEGYFSEMRDGYRFAVALALAREADIPRPQGARKNIFSTSTLDPDHLLKLAVDTLRPSIDEPAYRIAERLADWGIAELNRHLYEDYGSIESLLARDV